MARIELIAKCSDCGSETPVQVAEKGAQRFIEETGSHVMLVGPCFKCELRTEEAG